MFRREWKLPSPFDFTPIPLRFGEYEMELQALNVRHEALKDLSRIRKLPNAEYPRKKRPKLT